MKSAGRLRQWGTFMRIRTCVVNHFKQALLTFALSLGGYLASCPIDAPGVRINPDLSTGQALIYQYYTVRSGW